MRLFEVTSLKTGKRQLINPDRTELIEDTDSYPNLNLVRGPIIIRLPIKESYEELKDAYNRLSISGNTVIKVRKKDFEHDEKEAETAPMNSKEELIEDEA